MQLNINLDNVWPYDDETVATAIKREVDEELRKYVRSEMKAALKAYKGKLERYAKKAIEKDWQAVAKVLEQISEG